MCKSMWSLLKWKKKRRTTWTNYCNKLILDAVIRVTLMCDCVFVPPGPSVKSMFMCSFRKKTNCIQYAQTVLLTEPNPIKTPWITIGICNMSFCICWRKKSCIRSKQNNWWPVRYSQLAVCNTEFRTKQLNKRERMYLSHLFFMLCLLIIHRVNTGYKSHYNLVTTSETNCIQHLL